MKNNTIFFPYTLRPSKNIKSNFKICSVYYIIPELIQFKTPKRYLIFDLNLNKF